MRLLRLQLLNFGPFVGEIELPLANLGLVAIEGVNLADPGSSSNGCGKSSILDALVWGLYGETTARKETSSADSGLRGDEVVSDKVGKDCRVTVDFVGDDGHTYRVNRWRKAVVDNKRGNGVVLRMNSDAGWPAIADLDKGNVQAAIDAHLGLDRELFIQTVLRSQEDSFSFAQATPRERFALLTKIEGLEELDIWEKAFREKARNLAVEVAGIQSQLDAKSAALVVLREEATRAIAAREQWQRDLDSRRVQARNNVVQTQQALDDIAARLTAQPQHEARMRELDAALLPLQPPAEPLELAQWEGFRRELQQKLGASRSNKDRVHQRLLKLNATRTGTCEACGQEITPEHLAQHRSSLETEKTTFEAELTAIQTQEADAGRIVSQTRSQLDLARSAISAQRSQIEHERSHVLQQLASLRAHQQSQVSLQAQHARFVQEEQTLAAQVNPYSGFASSEQRVLAFEGEIERLKASHARAQVELGLNEWWVKNLPSLKAWIFDSVVGEITKEANRWLSILTGGLVWLEVAATATTKAGELRDKISMRCFRFAEAGQIVEREFRQWSGGEKRRIALALDWALAARLSQRAKSSCSFLALDEVDRHLDAAGRTGLLAALEELRKEKETVLFVTHDQEMRARPDLTWIVTKTAQGSSVEVHDGQARFKAA